MSKPRFIDGSANSNFNSLTHTNAGGCGAEFAHNHRMIEIPAIQEFENLGR